MDPTNSPVVDKVSGTDVEYNIWPERVPVPPSEKTFGVPLITRMSRTNLRLKELEDAVQAP